LVSPCTVPPASLLDACRSRGAYADCYVVEADRAVTLAQFVAAFYTTGVFRLERLILKWAVSRPSTDVEAHALARGERDSFAAWRVEGRRDEEILLADFTGRTRSWLKAEPLVTTPGRSRSAPRTRLYFGSAVMPQAGPSTGRPTPGRRFNALLGFHKLYSRILLHAACSRVAGGSRA